MKSSTTTLFDCGTGEMKEYAGIYKVNCWHNVNGNPTFKIYMQDDSVYTLVDNYSFVRGYCPCTVVEVDRKKDL